ncbi:DUF1176 domain-containing protein [Xanthomonas oryzae]|uniref:DUF1176 domain-containing protein n=2 Tax=Xanthomonas oryzae TaxID=347 RepID=UPI0006565349|nr:DUF1176 domain-containing protein [Xanthomonas oryzae]AKN95257.1 hypothetical protein ACU13_10990 [Xanthomonas oryzae pv. oryzicola]AKN98986.1 hypothetical protein ACU10_10935 [Xanthomonas oryzae pv. oryzicola]AKO14219.1 hypothetical protein ACU14_10935 [Xanthomonas oryzae pv. oryzicola]AKO17942.1 hypothetical protein ACU12_10980 [Xanthomonas oryzae pv. oryzicola]AKO21828.1 hypothetical protein ACU11_10125 [Xanthomonas oryzae pv. oryzicola]
MVCACRIVPTFVRLDWTIACDNTRTCRAAGYQADEGEHLPVSVLLTRKAGAGQAVTAELMLGQYDEIKMPAALMLRIDRCDLGKLALDRSSGTAPLSDAQVTAVRAALRGSSTIVAVGNAGRRWPLSDRGASAVLLKMDEFQGRLGTRGALVRKGDRDESKVLPAVPAPQVRAVKLPAAQAGDARIGTLPALFQALRASLPADEECKGLQAGDAQEPLTVTRLSTDKLLVSTDCWTGAYNVGTGFRVVNARAPFMPTLVTTQASDIDGSTLLSSQKGRGRGDCDSEARWTWNGRRFVPTSKSTSGLCRLVAAGGAWELPTLVTEVK